MSDRLERILEDLADPEGAAEHAVEDAAQALLEEADASDAGAFNALRRVHTLIVPERSRSIGLALCRELKRRTRGRRQGFRCETLEITIGIARHSLDILLIPSVFEPEEWGTTFLEGLLRKPADEYAGRVLVELGTGSGWISIALGKFTELARIHGIDINPHAPLVSEVNAILNSYDERGAPLYDAERRLLYEKCSFRTSDLLQVIRESGERADYIIGSIPQVPRPDLGPVTADADARTLYDLSNYAQLQGVYEDRHGLGLIARALDQAIACLERDGRVVFNLAGRPGRAVIERMFTKRGYVPRVIWRSRTQQAADTDIGELAELERRTGVDFEFYLAKTSQDPVSARTAVKWRGAGGELWHDLLVYEANLRHPRERIALDAALERMGFGDLGRSTDLSAANAAQLAFALRVARGLHRRARLPYVHEQGSPAFREELAAYLDKFWGLGATADDLHVGPSRPATACALLQALCDPLDTVLLSRNVAEAWMRPVRRAGVHPLVGNSALDELVELARGLKPRVVVVRAGEAERRNVRALEALVALDATVIFDETDELRLVPELYKNEILEFLAERNVRNAVVLAELRERQVYAELELAIALGPPALMQRVAAAGEAAYCRISHVAELYFSHLLDQALAFHITLGRGETTPIAPAPVSPPAPRASARMQMLQALPAFTPEAPPEADVIRLDYGENEYPVPRRLVAGLLAGLLEPPQPGFAAAVRQGAAACLQRTRGGSFAPESIAVGAGVVPLIADLIAALGRRLGRAPRVVLPAGYYGIFPGVIALAGGICAIRGQLKLTPADVGDADVALLTHPGNPTGLYYEEAELRALAAAVPHLVVDEIYGLTGEVPWFSAARLEQPGVAVLFGLSKEFSAGGLRVGFCACRDATLAAAIESEALVTPDRFALRAAEHLFARPADMDQYLRELRQHLFAQRKKMADALAALGITAPTPQGGLCLFPEVGDDQRFARLLRERARLWVNTGAWAGTPGRVRLVYSLEPRRADEAADRLRKLTGPWGTR